MIRTTASSETRAGLRYVSASWMRMDFILKPLITGFETGKLLTKFSRASELLKIRAGREMAVQGPDGNLLYLIFVKLKFRVSVYGISHNSKTSISLEPILKKSSIYMDGVLAF